MKLKVENRKLTKDKKVKAKILAAPVNEKIITNEKKRIIKSLYCRGIRPEDFQPCRMLKQKHYNYCYLHQKVLGALLKRRAFIFDETDNNKADDTYNQFRQFIDEHLNQLFPDESAKYPTDCDLSQNIWLNRNDFIAAPPGQCVALNLRDGTSICGKICADRTKYCKAHVDIKGLHAELYHVGFDNRPYATNFIYYKVYQGSTDQFEHFYKKYLEFFLRLEHLTIFQIKSDTGHIEFTISVVKEMAGDENHYLPMPKSFYRNLYAKFCTPGTGWYLRLIGDWER